MTQILRTEQDVAKLIRWLERLKLDKPWQFQIEPYRKSRSNPQNAALWGVAYAAMMDPLGLQGDEDKQALHEILCGLYWGTDEYTLLGQRKKRPKRTTTTGPDGRKDVLSTVDFIAFYEFVQRKGAEFGIYVPSPNEEEMNV